MTTTLGNFAKSYDGKTTKNISELKEVDVNLELEEREGTDSQNQKFKYKVIVVDGVEYRVPTSVITNLRVILEKKPTLRKFSVAKQGTTKDDTRYTIIPLD